MHISDEVIKRASALSSATLHEAGGKIGALPSAIKPISPEYKICGSVTTVQSPPSDNLWLHRAIYEAEPGTILVVDVNGKYEHGYWGEIMAVAAQMRCIQALVIDGMVRDRDQMIKMNFPVFSRGLCIRGTSKDFDAFGRINEPIRIEDVQISPGDLLYGDADGCIVLPAAKAEAIVKAGEEREAYEEKIIADLKAGASTLDIYNFRI